MSDDVQSKPYISVSCTQTIHFNNIPLNTKWYHVMATYSSRVPADNMLIFFLKLYRRYK